MDKYWSTYGCDTSLVGDDVRWEGPLGRISVVCRNGVVQLVVDEVILSGEVPSTYRDGEVGSGKCTSLSLVFGRHGDGVWVFQCD